MTVSDMSFPFIDVGPVTQAIQRVFQTLEPWFGAQSDVPAFDDIVQRIQLQGRKYAQAVDLSSKTSEDGIILANEVLVLCSEIANGGDETAIKGFFQGLLIIAETAHERATICWDLFKEVRSNIATISNRVPKATTGMTKQLANVETSASRSATASRVFGLVADAARDTTSGIDPSPAGLILPIALPLLSLVARGTEYAFTRKVEKRERERVTLKGALARLKPLERDLEHIHSCLGHVVEWWSGIKEKLCDMERVMRHQGISAYQNEAILNALRGGWGDVKRGYRMYLSKTTVIQDYYRSQYESESEEMDVGFKGRLLGLQRSVKVFYDGLIQLEHASSSIRGGRHEKLQQSIRSMRKTFLAHLTTLLEYLRKLEKSADGGGIGTKFLGNHYLMRETLQNVLEQANNHCLNLSVKLQGVHYIVGKEHWRTRAILDSMKFRTKYGGVTRESVLQLLHRVEEAVRSISRFCTDLSADGPWHGGNTLVERNLLPSVKNTIHAVEYLKEKLENV